MERRETLQNLSTMAVVFVLLLQLPEHLNVYHRSVVMFTMMYVILASSWNIISGFTGYVIEQGWWRKGMVH